MRKKQQAIIDNSQLAKAGFKEFDRWHYLVRKGVQRRVYLKRLGNDIIKAYQHERGFTFGILEEENKPLCRVHGFADTIDEMKQKLSTWMQTR